MSRHHNEREAVCVALVLLNPHGFDDSSAVLEIGEDRCSLRRSRRDMINAIGLAVAAHTSLARAFRATANHGETVARAAGLATRQNLRLTCQFA